MALYTFIWWLMDQYPAVVVDWLVVTFVIGLFVEGALIGLLINRLFRRKPKQVE